MAPRIIIALVLSIVATPSPVPGPPEPVDTAAPATMAAAEPTWTGVRVVGLENDPVRSAEAANVIERFAEVGLELPTVTVEFHESTSACNGHDGFIRYRQPAPAIAICSDRPYVLPHELAHAWVDANVSDAEKADYVERWGLASWNDAGDDWNDRGTEHAAFVIQQNLTAASPRMTTTWRERAEAFEMLTGLASPLPTNSAA